MAAKDFLNGLGVANLGFGGILMSVVANSVGNGLVVALALESGIIVGSALDAAAETFVPYVPGKK